MTFSTKDLDLEMLGSVLMDAWQSRSPSEQVAFAQLSGVPVEALGIATGNISEPTLTLDNLHPVWSSEALDASLGSALDHSLESHIVDGYPIHEPIDSAQLVLTPPPNDLGDESRTNIVARLGSSEINAALSGALHPKDLVADHPPELANLLLDQLASNFDRTRSKESWSWTLKSDRRTNILKSIQPAEFPKLLERASTIPTDPSGETLRRLLQGENISDTALTVSLEARLQAATWVLPIQPSIEPQLKALRHESYVASLLSSYDYLLRDGFFGRRDEINRIHSFATRVLRKGQISMLSVTGIGGSGKSTLLAAALRPLIVKSFEVPTAPMVVNIDFDHRAFINGAELELSFELTRQLGHIVPSSNEDFELLREQLGRERVERGESSKKSHDAGSESSSRQGSEFEWRAKKIVKAHNINQRPLIVVLDTFEEWQRETYNQYDSEAPFNRILEWLYSLQNEWELAIGVIVSGRAPVPIGGYVTAADPIDLRNLKKMESIALLQSLGVAVKPARQLVRIVGGVPLSLKLAARYYTKLPENLRGAFLEDANSELEGVEAALCQGLLYKRFLEHIADPQARKLAHPGLALRRVTPTLIQEVLAEPCELGVLSEKTALEIFHRLAQEVWLVEIRGVELTHRPEIRRMMLGMMNNDPEHTDKVRAVHKSAMRWYSNRPDRRNDDLAEALYHRISLAGPDDIEDALRSAKTELLESFAQSAGDFPDIKRVQFLDRLRRKLSMTDARLLPEDRRVKWATERAEYLVRTGQPNRALDTWSALAPRRTPGPWYGTATFQSGRWQPISLIKDNGFDYHSYPLSYHFLMTHVLRESNPDESRSLLKALFTIVKEQVNGLDREKTQNSRITVFENLYFQAAVDPESYRALLFNHNVTRYRSQREELSGATQYLRIRALPGSNVVQQVSVKPRQILAGIFQPTRSFLDAIGRLLRNMGCDTFQYTAFASAFGDLIEGELKSADILGRCSGQFSQAVHDSFGKTMKEEELALLTEGMHSDDPEWRVPIRSALVAATKSPNDFQDLASLFSEVLEPWIPSDFRPDAIKALHEHSSRNFWLKAVEYADRCGSLPHFMSLCLQHHSAELRRVALAYLEWIQLREALPT